MCSHFKNAFKIVRISKSKTLCWFFIILTLRIPLKMETIFLTFWFSIKHRDEFHKMKYSYNMLCSMYLGNLYL